MPKFVEWIGLVAGIVMILAVSGSMMRALIVPRGLSTKLGATVGLVVRKAFITVANRFESYETKDKILACRPPRFCWFFC